MVRAWLVIAALLMSAWPAPAAFAQTVASEPAAEAHTDHVEEAKRAFHEGIELVAQERWPEAEARFRRSVELVPRASSLYNWALSLCELRRYDECIAATDRLFALAPASEQGDEYVGYATQLRERARAALPPPAPETATPALTPATPPPAPVIAATETAPPTPLVMTTRPREPARDEGGIPASWLVMGGGAVVLAGALVTAILATAADDEVTSSCPEARDCDPSLRPVARRAKALALATDILLVTGAATLGTGLTLWLIEDDEAPRVAGGGLALRGALP